MRKLKLVGLSADGQQVVFVDDSGAEFAAPADDRLRAALRGDRARLGQLEIEMDSALRPRDIQARIRSGETPEAVASLAQVSVDKIMPYCVPVLAERQHVAELARRSHVRRKNVEGPARRLTDVVAERLRSRSVDPESARWDAWRRDDGRWSIGVSYLSGERERDALFAFDSMGRYSVAEDDEARWLTGEKQSTSKGPQPRETGRPGDRRLAAVPDAHADEAASDDLLSLAEDSDDLTAVVRAVRGSEAAVQAHVPAEAEDEAAHDDEPDAPVEAELEAKTDPAPSSAESDTTDSEEPVAEGDEEVVATQREPRTEPTPERKRKSGRRASVPSWDEIMLGKRKDG
jgi:hypothetical protein